MVSVVQVAVLVLACITVASAGNLLLGGGLGGYGLNSGLIGLNRGVIGYGGLGLNRGIIGLGGLGGGLGWGNGLGLGLGGRVLIG